MTKINVLDASVFNRIAAGEVVERPASVVKELVENGIDAGATSIAVEIRQGGKTSIRVSDNGCGIPKEELRTAFLPHATSKIKTADDLNAIATLGFRGEALASIAAVADVSVISKPADQETGAKIEIQGTDCDVSDVGSPDGTYFTVTDLFGRVPARAKFLEKDYREEAAVTDLMARLVLSHPEIAFRYVADGKKIYQSYGQGMRDAVACVYGANVLDELIPIDVTQGELTLKGFIGRESFSKPNRTYQTLIVNRRYVSNQTVSNAVFYAYADRLMKRQFPFYVLYLDLPADRVDVNVHPNKLDVRFVDKNAVYSLVNVTVAHALSFGYRIPEAESAATTIPEKAEPLRYVSTVQKTEIFSKRRDPVSSFSNSSEARVAEPSEIFARAGELMRANAARASSEEREHATSTGDVLESAATAEQVTVPIPDAYRVVGVAFDTYLIVDAGNRLYFVDQHAAHERLLYDRICEKRSEEIGVQNLLLSYVFEVTPAEALVLRENLSGFSACGIDIEEFGERSFKIGAVPAPLADIDLKSFVSAILADPERGVHTRELTKERLMQEACKSAVKGGDRLSESDLGLLMSRIASTNATLLCPHGRPIAVAVDKTTVEKWFKRIVS